MSLPLAVLVAAAIALVAWRAGTLSRSGTLAATVVGTLVLWPTGWGGCAVLGAFASALGARNSALGARNSALGARHSALGGEQVDLGGRGWRQVAANGGVAAGGALGEFWVPGLGIWLLTIVLAAAGADTWATSFGGRSKRPPRDILRRRTVEPGTSGGITWVGTAGGAMGAGFIGAVGGVASQSVTLGVTAAVIGVLGMLFDSVLGSALQGRFWCGACDQATERRVHRCGTRTIRTAGWAWLDNDLVNFTTTLAAFGAGLALWPTS